MTAKTFTRTVDQSQDEKRLFILVDNITLCVDKANSFFIKGQKVKVRIDMDSAPRYTVSSISNKYAETYWRKQLPT